MTDFYRYKNIEFSKPDAIKEAQEKLLKNHLDYILRNSPYYRRVLNGFDTANVTLENLSALPFTDKYAFEEYNNELLAVPMSEIVDIVLPTCTMDRCFIAGLAYFFGIKRLGAAAIRNGLSSFASHLEIIQRMQPTAIVGVPSFLRKLGLFLKSKNINPHKTNVARLVCIGEPIRDKNLSLLKMREQLEETWGARVFSTYASSETITTFCECTAQKGGHLHPELAIAEIVNDKGEVLPPKEIGEVVVTTLSIEGMPLLRFKTGD